MTFSYLNDISSRMFCFLFLTIFSMALGQVGQLETVTDLMRSDIQDMAKFAVQEYNAKNHPITGVHESLDSIVSAKTQVK